MKNRIRQALFYLLFLLITSINLEVNAQQTAQFQTYNVVWDTPSKDASESMPVGGGDIGCNVWVENGDILLYMQRSGCFSENGEYLKLGRIRLSLSPNPFKDQNQFQQELVLKDGYVTIRGCGNDTEGGFEARLNVWIDRETHSIHFGVQSNMKIKAKAAYESWRTENKLLLDEKRGRFGCFGLEGYPEDVVKYKDSICFVGNTVQFYHRNGVKTLSPDVMIEQQGLYKFKDQIVNNIRNLTFGGILSGTGMIATTETTGRYCDTPFRSWNIESKKAMKTHHITLSTHIQQCDEAATFITGLSEINKKALTTKGNWTANKNWWNNFWQRSWIVTDPKQMDKDSLMWQMGRNYQLFRYQLGCNLAGEYPTKFNGGNFTVDPSLTTPSMTHDPDWRQWGGDVFTAQNQRLVYWPMLKSGDADGLKSQFNLYEQGLNGARLKVKEHFGHEGAIFCEYINAAGLDFGAGWGWNKGALRLRGEELPFGHPDIKAVNTYNQSVEKGVMANGSIAYHWESQVEHAYMMLEYHRFTGVNIDRYIPFIKESLIFFDQHYQKRQQLRNGKSLDEHGKLVFFPSTSCESYRGAKNPTDLISGIAACLESLLLLDSEMLTATDKSYFKAYLQRLPALSYGEVKGDRIVKPAESYMKYQNVECPQFYPLFPFNRFDIESDQMPTFRNTWKHGDFPKNMVISWHQDGIFFARMGMVDEALAYNQKKLQNSQRRFPSFWGPGHDWVPDHNWGGTGMLGLQEMLIQTVGNTIHLLPAWPKGKDVCFKLHAPHNTTIEVEYINGVLQKLDVKPKQRRKDIKIMLK